MKKNTPIVETKKKIIKKFSFKCFYYKFTFSLRGKAEEKEVKY
jgi:hypothetical protein